MELCIESLDGFLKKRHRRLSGTEARQIMLHTAKGLAHLKASNIIHRDIKTENVMLGTDHNWKLCDFGLSLQGQQVAEISGTIYILAPELFNTEEPKFSFQSDVFAYGVLLMHIAMNPSESRMLELSYGKVSKETVKGVQKQMARTQFPSYEDFEKKWKKLKPEKTSMSELIKNSHIEIDDISNLKELIMNVHLPWKEETMLCALAFVREVPANRLDITQFIGLQETRIEEPLASETHDKHSKCPIS
ncbi:serine/threonine-protein kinase [Elysia marginata]|uniref:Serine/threonine-protein kinase n=1 Tax=Elysia marginata TaxID=1093978 RepID=A0AAV4IF30_9GAST|nr:serine/threonine-protein kinase [Elysia marginata]